MKRILITIAAAMAATSVQALPAWHGDNPEYPRSLSYYDGSNPSGRLDDRGNMYRSSDRSTGMNRSGTMERSSSSSSTTTGTSASGAATGASSLGSTPATGYGNSGSMSSGSGSGVSSGSQGAVNSGVSPAGVSSSTTGVPMPQQNYQPGATISNPNAINSGPTGR